MKSFPLFIVWLVKFWFSKTIGFITIPRVLSLPQRAVAVRKSEDKVANVFL